MRAAITVGVTGHRDLRCADLRLLVQSLKAQIDILMQQHERLHIHVGNAPGADYLVARVCERTAKAAEESRDSEKLRVHVHYPFPAAATPEGLHAFQAAIEEFLIDFGQKVHRTKLKDWLGERFAFPDASAAAAPIGSGHAAHAKLPGMMFEQGSMEKTLHHWKKCAEHKAEMAVKAAENVRDTCRTHRLDFVRTKAFGDAYLDKVDSEYQSWLDNLATFLAEETDVLIALWDGVDTGLPGGTSSIVHRACERTRAPSPRFLQLVTPRKSNPFPIGVPLVWRTQKSDRPRQVGQIKRWLPFVKPFLALLALAAIVGFGWWGFSHWDDKGRLDNFLRALGLPLDQTNLPGVPGAGWQLQVARLVGAFVPFVAYFAVLALVWGRFVRLRVRWLFVARWLSLLRHQLSHRDERESGLARRFWAFVKSMPRFVRSPRQLAKRVRHDLWENTGYTIVLGLGWTGQELVKDLRRRGLPVAAVDLSPRGEELDQCKADGALVLAGDATSPAFLSQLQLSKAEQVYVAAGSDETNLRIVNAVAEVCRLGRTSELPLTSEHPLQVFTQLSDEHFRNLGALLTKGRLPIDVRAFHVPEIVAQRALDEYPLDRFIRAPALPPRPSVTRVIILGDSAIAEAVLFQCLRVGYFVSSRLQIDVIAPDPTGFSGRVHRRCPALRPDAPLRHFLPRLRFHQLPDAIESLLDPRNPLFASISDGGIVTAYVCIDDGLGSAAYVAALGPAIESECTTSNGVGTKTRKCDYQLLYYYNYPGASDHSAVEAGLNALACTLPIIAFGLGAVDCESVTQSTVERLARGVHQAYSGKSPVEHPIDDHVWLQLDEDDRASSRHSAAHITVKLRELGILLEDVRKVSSGVDRQLRSELIKLNQTLWNGYDGADREVLAELEHRRWNGDQLLRGWRQNTEKRASDATGARWAQNKEGWKRRLKLMRQHVLIVPYDELHDEPGASEKCLDREIVDKLATIVGSAGFKMVRAPSVSCGEHTGSTDGVSAKA